MDSVQRHISDLAQNEFKIRQNKTCEIIAFNQKINGFFLSYAFH